MVRSSHSTRASHERNRPDTDHSTGVADHGRWSTRRIAFYALFTALAMAASFLEIPLMPAAPWLKYDPSGIICLISGFAFGPSAAIIVSILGFLPHLFMDPWGAIMAILVALASSVAAALIYRRHTERTGAVVALVVGSLLAILVALGANLIITPLYAHMSVQQVAMMILPVLLPFNLIKFVINAVCTFILYKPISRAIGHE